MGIAGQSFPWQKRQMVAFCRDKAHRHAFDLAECGLLSQSEKAVDPPVM